MADHDLRDRLAHALAQSRGDHCFNHYDLGLFLRARQDWRTLADTALDVIRSELLNPHLRAHLVQRYCREHQDQRLDIPAVADDIATVTRWIAEQLAPVPTDQNGRHHR